MRRSVASCLFQTRLGGSAGRLQVGALRAPRVNVVSDLEGDSLFKITACCVYCCRIVPHRSVLALPPPPPARFRPRPPAGLFIYVPAVGTPFQDLLETLQTAVDVELSLTVNTVTAPDHKNASPPLRKLPHQRSQQPPLVREALSAEGRGGGGGGGSGGSDGDADANFDRTPPRKENSGAATAVLTPAEAAASAVRAAARREAERNAGAPPRAAGNRNEAAVLTSALATMAAAAGKKREGDGKIPEKNGARAAGKRRNGSAGAVGGSGGDCGGNGNIHASSNRAGPSDDPTRGRHQTGKGPPDGDDINTAATAANCEVGMRYAAFGGTATVAVPAPTTRVAAARARAEELAAAKFAGIRSAAKAKGDVDAAAGEAGAGPAVPSFGQG